VSVIVNSPPGSQVGVKDGVYSVDAELWVNGKVYPWLQLDVDLNAYAVAGVISAVVPQAVVDPVTGIATWRDFSAEAAANPYVPVLIKVGYADASTTPGPVPLFPLESGYLDETTDTYEADMVDLALRNNAVVFQDVQVTEAAQTNRLGSDLATYYYSKQAQYLQSATIIPSPGGNYVGKVGYTEAEFLKAYRARTMWDELQDAALLDAYILRLHLGNFYYGPPPASNQYPVVGLRWIGPQSNPQQGDLTGCRIQHAARRSHAITVRVDGYDAKNKKRNSATYGPAGFGGAGSTTPTNGVQYRLVHQPGDLPSLRALAFKVWHDLVHREYIATLELVPDAALMQTIAQSGSDFLVSLSGVKPSHALIYSVRHVKVAIQAGDSTEPSLKVTLLCANYADQVGGGQFL
jgi:hypothetical protein